MASHAWQADRRHITRRGRLGLFIAVVRSSHSTYLTMHFCKLLHRRLRVVTVRILPRGFAEVIWGYRNFFQVRKRVLFLFKFVQLRLELIELVKPCGVSLQADIIPCKDTLKDVAAP